SKTLFEPDGAAWFAALGGVARFDGRDAFTLSTEDGLPDNLVIDIARASDGTLWIATLQGVARYKPGPGRSRLVKFDPASRLCNDTDLHLSATPDGAVWVRAPQELVRFHGTNETRFTNLWSADANWIPSGAMAVAPDGRLWVGGKAAGLIR